MSKAERDKRYREQNAGKLREYHRDYYERNRESLRAKQAEYSWENLTGACGRCNNEKQTAGPLDYLLKRR